MEEWDKPVWGKSIIFNFYQTTAKSGNVYISLQDEHKRRREEQISNIFSNIPNKLILESLAEKKLRKENLK